MTENITINLKEYLDDRFVAQTKLHQYHGKITKANINSLKVSMASIQSGHSSNRSWTTSYLINSDAFRFNNTVEYKGRSFLSYFSTNPRTRYERILWSKLHNI